MVGIARGIWFGLSALLTTTAQTSAPDDSVRPLRADSDAPYVHRLTLYDEHGQAIDPRDELAKPYSPKATCGKCHEVGTIALGWHFNAAHRSPKAARRGEPWVLADSQTGQQIPLSYRGWPGSFDPAALGLSEWQFVSRFGRHLPGGGVGDLDPAVRNATREATRWNISGSLENDCMSCHTAAGATYDAPEWARQIERENFRWAPSAALGLALVRRDAKRLPDDFDPDSPPSPDYPERQPPQTIYDLRRFDGEDRVLFPISSRVPNERCSYCHSAHRVGADAPPRWQQQEDVHLAAGISCVDCHRHGIDHAVTRGYEDEANDSCQPSRAALSCVGCHLGRQFPLARLSADSTALMLGGPLPAPRPEHVGIPPVHFEKLTCTACHSGPWPDETTWPAQTAMAHALGLSSRERDAGTLPNIEEPVFAIGDDGRIAPHRALWPAYWGITRGARFEPLPLEEVRAALGRILPKPKIADAPAVPLSDQQITAGLRALTARAARPTATPGAASASAPAPRDIGYLRDGWLYRLADDKLQRAAHPGAKPYLWPVAHAVRPASRSLGARGCTDCHADDAPILVGELRTSTDPPDRFAQSRQSDLRGDDAALQRAWSGAFAWRTEFKLAAFALLGATGLVFLRWLLDAIAPVRASTAQQRADEGTRA